MKDKTEFKFSKGINIVDFYFPLLQKNLLIKKQVFKLYATHEKESLPVT